ncbi:MAG: hypothetical protein IJQ12_11290 [Lachnospiraceae bacterium]|nr:hypothetical protein [Lachnospiraceae bacterium]
MAKKKVEDKINLDSILFKCRDILRAAHIPGNAPHNNTALDCDLPVHIAMCDGI